MTDDLARDLQYLIESALAGEIGDESITPIVEAVAVSIAARVRDDVANVAGDLAADYAAGVFSSTE